MKSSAHRISIPNILNVGRGNLNIIGQILESAGFNNVVLFFGPGIRDLFGEIIMNSFIKTPNIKIIEQYENDDNTICSITGNAFMIPSNADVIVGIGGGKVLDIAKYTAFLNNMPFISVPTSTSHDGFASSGCSLIINGKRTSVPAKMPFGIVVDIDIIKSSPDKFIYSGIGDLVSKITAVYDWEFEKINGKTTIDDFAVMIAKKSVNSVVRTEFTGIKDDFFLMEFVDSLTMSGISMEIAGRSAPASGSEHLISHALDQFVERPELHGIQVGIATYIMSIVQNHRFERIRKFLSDTGFFNFVGELVLKKSDFARAIDIAPTIKPQRYTYIHIQENREYAKTLLDIDPIISKILK